MQGKNKVIDPLPETFATAEEAGEFWDTHSTIDYEEYLEPVAALPFAFECVPCQQPSEITRLPHRST